jgi:hypothetical protein
MSAGRSFIIPALGPGFGWNLRGAHWERLLHTMISLS